MKIQKKTVLIPIIFFITLMQGCTAKSWYEGGKQSAENNCRSQPPSQVDRCMDKLNKKTYQEYEKERSSSK